MNNPANTKWHAVSANVVYGAIANTSLGENASPNPTVGSVTLHDHQQDAVARLIIAIREFGGALLADTVGLGKTYVALAVAAQFKHVHVLAPANLLPMWRDAIAATHRVNVSLHSLHTLSRRALANNNPQRETLVIVDEAHHLRTQNTTRYRNASQFMAGRSALLLSATPLHNRAKELQNILALFLGHRSDSLDDSVLAECIVRRTASHTPVVSLPAIHEHAPHAISDNPPVLESILTLPAPLPTQDGAAASALVRLGLLRAWCSSDAALTDTIRRRQLRGEALLHSLAHGRYPTQRELQTWIVGNDSIQLGFPELLVATATVRNGEMLTTLTKHLDALNSLLQLHTRTALAEPQRASMLRSLLQENTPVIAFSQFASTVRALHRALKDVAGVASLTSKGGRVAGGPIQRQELIAQFAPRAHSRPPPPAHERIRLLLTTDMLSEGVNLQDAGILVHLDLPWTDATRAQRVGRLARLGSPHETIHVHTIAPPAGAERTLRLIETLKRKAHLSDTLVGTTSASAGGSESKSESAAECATRLRARMLQWRHDFIRDSSRCVRQNVNAVTHNVSGLLCHNSTAVACSGASRAGWIAVVAFSSQQVVLASSHADSQTCSNSAIDIMRTIDCIADSRSRQSKTSITSAVTIAPALDSAIAVVNRWYENNCVNELAGRTERSLSPSHKRALRLLSERMATNPAATRNSFATMVDRIATSIAQIAGAGIESQLDEWCRHSPTLKLPDWFNAFFNTVQSVPPGTKTHIAQSTPFRVSAILLLQPSQYSSF